MKPLNETPFNSKAEPIGCLIMVEREDKPKHFQVLAEFKSFEDCKLAYAVWKESK